MSEKKKRTRNDTPIEKVVDIICPHVHGIDFIEYDEGFKTAKCKPHLILKAKEMWQGLFNVNANMRFTDKKCDEIMTAVLEKKEEEREEFKNWGEKERSEWMHLLQLID